MSAGVGIELQNLTVSFGDFVAVRDATVTIEGGEFFSFLGPSGCGKTTILRTVSGFQEPSGGRVRIGGNDMAGIGPNKRPTALIFQNLALFPADAGVGEHHLRPGGEGQRARPSGAAAPTSCSSSSLCRATARSCQLSFRAARSSGSRSRARSVPSRRCCCSTSRFRRSISSCASTCAPSCAPSSSASASPSSISPTIRARRSPCPTMSR